MQVGGQLHASARKARGDAAGTRMLIEVLLAHRSLPAAVLHAAMNTAVASGALDPQALLIQAGRGATSGQVAPVIPIGALARPAPTDPPRP